MSNSIPRPFSPNQYKISKRILVLSNFYSASRSGGYTQWCYEITEQLKARGYTVAVLTSSSEVEKAPPAEEQVYRLLHLEGNLFYYQPIQFFATWKKNHRENIKSTEKVLKEFAPDIVFVWGMNAISKAVPAFIESKLPDRVVYFLSDYWPAAKDMHTRFWKSPSRRVYTRLLKYVIGTIACSVIASEGESVLNFNRVICVSKAVKENLIKEGIPIHHGRIIYGGTDVQRFLNSKKTWSPGEELRLLYAGQLVEHKGVHTAIEALGLLINRYGIEKVNLTIIGSGHPDYEARIQVLVKHEGLLDYVVLHGQVPKSEMPEILCQFDVLVFPSIYEEPLARITQEAMAAGLVVVATTTGGTKEILLEGENGLTFEREDATGLATQISRLMTNPHLFSRLAEAGRQSIINYFNLDRMAAEIDAYLEEIISNGSEIWDPASQLET